VGDGLALPQIQAIKDPTRHARTTIAGPRFTIGLPTPRDESRGASEKLVDFT
jgi:hypothetical protein